MEGSLLEALGLEIIGVMAPVSICMLLVVLLVFNIDSQTSQAPITSVATLVYSEDSSDTNVQKFGGAILNALVFVVLISIVTFLLVLLYYYRCTNFLKNYIRFSTFVILASMGGSICLSIIQQFSIPIDAITCFVLLYNFSVVGVLSVFSGGIPIFVRQVYMVLLGIIVAAWFTKLPEWTTWVVLVALALYDLVAVLSPVGPLKLLVELASTRDEELPALVYEARPTVSRREDSAMNMLVGGVSASVLMTDSNSRLEAQPQVVELQAINRNRNQDSVRGEEQVVEIDPYSENLDSDRRGERSRTTEFGESSSHGRETNRTDEETTPLVSHIGFGVDDERPGIIDDMADHSSRGIKLGLGDFVFYSVLVGRAAMYDLMTVYACYIAIVSGLGCTLILLSVCHHALPALPISITLGVTFYFLTRLLMEPFVVGTSTNLVMF